MHGKIYRGMYFVMMSSYIIVYLYNFCMDKKNEICHSDISIYGKCVCTYIYNSVLQYHTVVFAIPLICLKIPHFHILSTVTIVS